MKKWLRIPFISLTAVFIFFSGCKHDPVVAPDPGGGGDCDTSNVTYNGTVFPLMQQYCLSCHSGASPSAGMNFNDYTTVATIA